MECQSRLKISHSADDINYTRGIKSRNCLIYDSPMMGDYHYNKQVTVRKEYSTEQFEPDYKTLLDVINKELNKISDLVNSLEAKQEVMELTIRKRREVWDEYRLVCEEILPKEYKKLMELDHNISKSLNELESKVDSWQCIIDDLKVSPYEKVPHFF